MKRLLFSVAALLGIFLLALTCQAVLDGLHIQFSSAVLGMIVLLIVFYIVGSVPRPLERASHGLLRYFPLFFVPASVGAMRYGALLAHSWVGLSVAIVASTLLGVWVAARVGTHFLAESR